jgi:hypothetical protein
MKKKMAWGLSPENLCNDFKHETFEDAFQEALEESGAEVGDTIHIAEIYPYDWKHTVCATSLVERMNEQAYDEVGEFVYVWPDCSKEEIAELDIELERVVGDWLRKIKQDQPRFWTCGASTEFIVTKEHLESLK